jgi:hypothetical protein
MLALLVLLSFLAQWLGAVGRSHRERRIRKRSQSETPRGAPSAFCLRNLCFPEQRISLQPSPNASGGFRNFGASIGQLVAGHLGACIFDSAMPSLLVRSLPDYVSNVILGRRRRSFVSKNRAAQRKSPGVLRRHWGLVCHEYCRPILVAELIVGSDANISLGRSKKTRCREAARAKDSGL